MFGYVKPLVPELKVGEYELFRAVYCGVCRAMGRHTGGVSRFFLNYDYVFLAAVRMALSDMEPVTSSRRCIVHPVKKRAMVEENPALAYTACAAACMLREKLADDGADERGFRQLLSRSALPLANGMLKRCGDREKIPSQQVIAEKTEALYALERENSPSVDEAAEAFGGVLAYVFSHGLEGSSAAVASEIGGAVGRFVYLCDAADDLVDDVAAGRYNPLAASWGEYALLERDGRQMISPMTAESIRCALGLDLTRLGLAVELLPAGHCLVPVIKNIVYLGMPATMDGILKKRTEGMEFLDR